MDDRCEGRHHDVNAIRMLVRRGWRCHGAASVLLALVAGLSAAVVGASFQAADRASTTLPRFETRSRVYDALVQGCPPEVPVSALTSSTDLLERCGNPVVQARLARRVASLPSVERTAGATTLVVGLLDRHVSNGWGRLGLLESTTTPGARIGRGNPIVVEGRNLDPDAPGEIVLSEAAARSTGIHAGATVRMAGWSQTDLDAAVDGRVRPQTRPFPVHVVGVVRFLDDVQAGGDISLSDSILTGSVYAGPGWYRSHGGDFSGYGSALLVRLRARPHALADLRRGLRASGWHTDVSGTSDLSDASPRQIIDIQRRAVLAFGAIAALAGLAFVGSSLVRQLRHEQAEVSGVGALGMTRLQQRLVGTARALTIGLPAALIGVAGVIALSPLGPVGLARQLEFSNGFRVDPTILACTAVGVLVAFGAFGASVWVGHGSGQRTSRVSRTASAAAALGPVPTVAASVARGRSTRAAVAMTAIAVAAGIAAATIVGSYDDLVAHPVRYGAWWDVAVGQYSDRSALEAGVASLRRNPYVVAATGYGDDTTIGRIDGRPIWLIGTVDYVGHRSPVVTEGRAPRNPREVALGAHSARLLHKGVGDTVALRTNLETVIPLRVVGIAVVSDPISSGTHAGDGALVRHTLLREMSGGTVPQSIVIALDPSRDRTRAIASLRRDFSGSLRAVIPQTDIRNVGRLRALPWLLAGLIVALALTTLVHALLTILGRHRATMAVVGALGFTRGQRRAVATTAGAGLTLAGAIVGVPLGVLVGARLWRAVGDGMGLAVDLDWPWGAIVLVPLGAVLAAILVAAVASRGAVRVRPGQELRVE